MTETILKSHASQISGFEIAVARHAQFRKEWIAHMERVAEDEKNGVTGIQKHQPYPPPHAHPLVLRAVNDRGEADYTIENDDPTPAQVLEAAKRDLSMQVEIDEQEAVEAIAPARRLRALHMRERDIASADEKNRASIVQPFFSKVKAVILGAPSLDEQVAALRSPDDTAFLQSQADLRAKIDAIRSRATRAHIEIEDLTSATIAAWKMPNLTA